MRFDDSLKTVLSADMATSFGAQAAWRQLIDLMGRGRMAVDGPALARLRELRANVPTVVRAASARSLAFADPDAGLVGFFAEDSLAIAAPVLRTANLQAEDWIALLPRLNPQSRSVLRHRRDLTPQIVRALESFGPTDFVLGGPEGEIVIDAPVDMIAETVDVEVAETPPFVAASLATSREASVPEPVTAQLSETPFVAVGDIARGLPVVAEALRHAAQPAPAPEPAAALIPAPKPVSDPPRFEISDLVARIDAFKRDPSSIQSVPVAAPLIAETFGYETDPSGAIRWVDGVSRAALIGVSLAYAAQQGEAQLDGVAAGAFRRRSRFTGARLQMGGLSDAAGSWRVSGVPAFDEQSGRFIGFRGTARRPRRDEMAEPVATEASGASASDSLRQLVHELRTPTNAIAGFAELIETELLGPVSPTYRERATAIRTQAADLLAAIDDLDIAARIEGHALDLRPGVVPVLPMLGRIIDDLMPLARLRGAILVLRQTNGLRGDSGNIAGDDRAVERLIGRLLATLVSAGSRGEQIAIELTADADAVILGFDRPRALASHAVDTLLSIDADEESDGDGAPLLGTGFALRLAQNLAVELGGNLAFGTDRLTLRLPAVLDREVQLVADQLR